MCFYGLQLCNHNLKLIVTTSKNIYTGSPPTLKASTEANLISSTSIITINENADPDVVCDLSLALNKTFPDRPQFRHAEGNSHAHMKSTCIGCSETVIVSDNRLLLGTWQGIYFVECDGPRDRTFYIKVMRG